MLWTLMQVTYDACRVTFVVMYLADVVGFAQAAVGEALRDVAPSSSTNASSAVASVTFCVGNAFNVIHNRTFDRIICRFLPSF